MSSCIGCSLFTSPHFSRGKSSVSLEEESCSSMKRKSHSSIYTKKSSSRLSNQGNGGVLYVYRFVAKYMFINEGPPQYVYLFPPHGISFSIGHVTAAAPVLLIGLLPQ